MLSYIRKYSILTKQFQYLNLRLRFYNKNVIQRQGKCFNRFLVPVVWATGYLYYVNKCKINCQSVNDGVQTFQQRRDNMKLQNMVKGNESLWQIIWSILCHVLRFFQLLAIFMPAIILFPFRRFGLKDFWLKVFVKSVERAGVVWIKCFQYMSHRGDIIGRDMADKFVHLRQNAPKHVFKQTEELFNKSYGQKFYNIFQQFDPIPIASGSVSQVYKAKYNGRKVAIKVRHPGVQKYIQRDINILFFFSHFLSLFSSRFLIPISEVSMKKTLIDQINFNHEKENLLIFNQMFKDSKIAKFPIPIVQKTNQAILVETFIEGVPITYFQSHPHPLNAVIARMGSVIFFQMLMKNNFIHADCHGGNIIVQIQDRKYNFFTQVKDFIKQKFEKIKDIYTLLTLKTDTFKQLYIGSQRQEEQVNKILKKYNQDVVVTLIDVGMVIRLEQRDRLNFIYFIKSILHGDGQKCAQMIYNLSLYDGKKLIQGEYIKYMSQLKQLFAVLDGQSVQKLQGVPILLGMLEIIRQNKMKLQGQFATLLTNILVLQGVARTLNPEINILKCAVPYFKFAEQNFQSKVKKII